MYAVIKSGGKQYRVEAGEKVRVEELAADVGATVSLDQVLLVGTGDAVKVGAPLVSGRQGQGHGRLATAAATRCRSSRCAGASTTRRRRAIGSRTPNCASTTSSSKE